jgi:hypothetical protein
MTTEAQTEANRRNAARSTGPKTPRGKGRSSANAVRHGLRSELPVLPGENVEEWERHRDGTLRSLAPVGTLEHELGERVALCLWRMRRVAAFETAAATAAIEQVEDETRRQRETKADAFGEPSDARKLALAEKELGEKRAELIAAEQQLAVIDQVSGTADNAPVDGKTAGNLLEMVGQLVPEDDMVDATDPDFLTELGVPEDELDECETWTGWTVGMVRKGVDVVSKRAHFPLAKLQARLTAWGPDNVRQTRMEVQRLEKELLTLRRRVKAGEERCRQQRVLPEGKTLDKVLRYESHLSRQMLQALHTLDCLQAARAGADVSPPAALDVTVSGPTEALEMALDNAREP